MTILKFQEHLKRHSLLAVILSVLLQASFYPQQDVSSYENRLKKIAGQIEELKSKIQAEEKKESSLLATLDRIGFRKNLIKKEIAFYNMQLKKVNMELNTLNINISQLQKTLDKQKESVAKILVTLYKFGNLSYLAFMLRVNDVESLIAENKHLTLLVKHQEKIVNDYITTLANLKAAEEKLENKKNETAGLVQNAQTKKKELEEEEKKNRAIIQEITRNKNMHLQALKELNDRAEQLQILVKKLEQEKMPILFPLVPLYEKKGQIPWPIEGKIVTHFGLQRHSEFNTITLNNGIEISPEKDTIVKAVHSGAVVYADYFQGYGNLVIIDHGMTYYSLYGHCTDFLVKKGDTIQTGQPIAVVGDIGSLKGITLYFEIRFKTKPLNPLQWLKGR